MDRGFVWQILILARYFGLVQPEALGLGTWHFMIYNFCSNFSSVLHAFQFLCKISYLQSDLPILDKFSLADRFTHLKTASKLNEYDEGLNSTLNCVQG